MKHAAFVAGAALVLASLASAQVSSFPYIESFDRSAVPPTDWTVVGWAVSTTSTRSAPNCLSATGNVHARVAASPPVAFGDRVPDQLAFYDRRTSTALRYRLALHAVNDDSSRIVHLGTWDSAATANTYVERKVDLSVGALLDARSWRFIWEVLRDSTNSTGVLRIDDIRILAAPAVDLSPTAIEFSDGQPSAGATIIASVTVHNFGRSATGSASLRLQCRDRSGGYGAATVPLSVKAGDSARVHFPVSATQPGRIEAVAISIASDDEDASNDTARAVLSVGCPVGAMVVNEIQFAPLRENEPEWIEVFNPGPWTVPLSEVLLSDNSTTSVPLTNREEESLSPGQFIILARSFEFSAYYPSVRNLLTPFPSLNNTITDAVVLRDVHGRMIDSAWYQPYWALPGRTLERRDWDMISWGADTWGSCEAADGATPGSVNSIQRPPIDASCEALSATLDHASMSLRLTAVARNRGRLPLPGGSIEWSLELLDSDPGNVRTLGTTTFGPIPMSDSSVAEFRWNEQVRGGIRLSARVAVGEDARPENDTSWSDLLLPYAAGSVLVNEVMFEPAPGRPEWFELVNVSEWPVNLAGWTVADLPSPSGSRVRTTLPEAPAVLVPGAFAVVASDASMLDDYPWLRDGGALVVIAPRGSGFGFNNDGDGVVVSDRTGLMIDSVVLSSSWHVGGLPTAGRSLERRAPSGSSADPAGWSSCADPAGASPGLRNSIARVIEGPSFHARIDPDPFSPDGDAFEDVAQIHYASGSTSLFLDVRIFDLSGREVRRLSDGNFVPSSGTLSWDGRNDAGRLVPIGVYIVLITATDAVSGQRERARMLSSVAR